MKKFFYKNGVYLLIFLLFCLLFLLNLSKPEEADWRYDFTAASRLPLGCELLKNNLESVFPGKNVEVSYETAYETIIDSLDCNKIFLIINDEFKPDEYELERIMAFIRNGGILFVSAFDFSDIFQKATEININTGYSIEQWKSISFEDPELNINDNYQVDKYMYPLVQVVDSQNPEITVLGRNNLGEPIFFAKDIGMGKLYLHFFPIGFCNYYMTEKAYYDYPYKVLSHLPNRDVLWDEFHKAGLSMIRSPLRFILRNQNLAWAYYLLLISTVLYIFFHGKREQRIIPVIEPFQNTSLEFLMRIAILHKFENKQSGLYDTILKEFAGYCRSAFRIEGDIFEEHNIKAIELFSSKEAALLKKIKTEIEKAKNIEYSQEHLLNVFLLMDEFYIISGIYGKHR